MTIDHLELKLIIFCRHSASFKMFIQLKNQLFAAGLYYTHCQYATDAFLSWRFVFTNSADTDEMPH